MSRRSMQASISTALTVCSALMALFAARPSTVAAQELFYGFEGDGWVQAWDELILLGNARVEMNKGTAYTGQNAVYFFQGPTGSGFRKTVPAPPNNQYVCRLYWVQQSSSAGIVPRLWISLVDPSTGELIYRNGVSVVDSPRWSENSSSFSLNRDTPAIGTQLAVEIQIGEDPRPDPNAWMRVDNLRFRCDPIRNGG